MAQRNHEVLKVAEKVSAEMERQVTKERKAAVEVEAAARKQEAEEMAWAERLPALRKNSGCGSGECEGCKDGRGKVCWVLGSGDCARGGKESGGVGSGLPGACDGGTLECCWGGCHKEGRSGDQVEWAGGAS